MKKWLALLCMIYGSLASAQVVATKDLTHDAPSPLVDGKVVTSNPEYCTPNGGNADGVIVSGDPVLSLSIAKAELVTTDRKPKINLTMILKNHGLGPALVPWSSSAVEPAPLEDENGMKRSGYVVATIDFWLGPPHSREGDLGLQYHVALWSQPDSAVQSIRVRAGAWVELKARADIVCRLSDSSQCIAKLRENRLAVSAWWYERLLTTSTKGRCIYETGAYTQRELDSKTADVGSTPLAASQEVEFQAAAVPK